MFTPKKQKEPPMKACPACGTRFTEVLAGHPLGCPECYRAFYSALIPFGGNTEKSRAEEEYEG